MSLLHIGGSSADDKLYVEDVFSTYLYTGNGSTQTINNGIDLAGKGGMVWIKRRSSVANNYLMDNASGLGRLRNSNNTNSDLILSSISRSDVVFNSNGFTLPQLGELTDSATYASWTFRNADKFFKATTKVHTIGTASTVDLSSLGTVGMVEVKSTIGTSNWFTYHRSATSGKLLYLNLTSAETTDASISVSGTTLTIAAAMPSDTYVIYAYAHDTSADGIIQCGSFSGNTTVTLGWEPQWMMIKRTDSTGDWITIDNMRGCSVGGIDAVLFPNLSSAESVANDYIDFTPTGFISNNLTGTYIYTVIRRPMKVPTSGTEVYNAIARTGTGAVATVSGVGFAPDLVMNGCRGSFTTPFTCFDRLRGVLMQLIMQTTQSEAITSNSLTNFDLMDGVKIGSYSFQNYVSRPYINHFFKRAKGFFDIVCYTGTGVDRTVNHNLGVVPELMIVKKRFGSADGVWYVYSSFLGASKELLLNMNLPAMSDGASLWNSTAPTLSTFSIGTDTLVNASTHTFVTYLFATCPNVSKVFNYTGNGSSLNVECGFSAGARFVLCKRTDSNGDWFVFDSVRGIVAANDPHLSLNTIDAEVTTDDSIDPYANGFTVNQNATTNLNVNGGTYIGLAIA